MKIAERTATRRERRVLLGVSRAVGRLEWPGVALTGR